MSHSDKHVPDDRLAAVAMGEPLEPVERDHIGGCSACTTRAAEYVHLMDDGRDLSHADVPDRPSPEVWSSITSELGLSDAPEGESQADVIPISGGRARRWTTPWLVAAAAAGIVAGVGVTVVGGAIATDEATPSVAPTPVLAQAALTSLPSKQGSGNAEIVETPEGQVLVVDVSDLSAGDGFYEVWLIDPKTFEMVGLGALTENEGRFPIPDGLDLSKYRIVDVSIEPFDGDPVHSRNSVVRGELNV